MRELPSLHSICLRAVGSHACSVERTFGRKDKETTEDQAASRLLRRFHRRPVLELETEGSQSPLASSNDADAIDCIPMIRTPCIGTGSPRRLNSNQVDLVHPFAGVLLEQSSRFIALYGNPALDVLQSYIDALVELGRMDDTRLGRYFFEEYKTNVLLGSVMDERPKKRSRNENEMSEAAAKGVASLSLHNCSLGTETIKAFVSSGLGPHLAVLDLTGIQGMTDAQCWSLLQSCPNIQKLSVKNVRRLTCAGSLQRFVTMSGKNTTLEVLDVGGCFNISCQEMIELILPNTPALVELHASGLGWSDDHLQRLVSDIPNKWNALSFGFTSANAIQKGFTSLNIRQHLQLHRETLTTLALPFCESLVDNALLGMLGRNLPVLSFLDVRGNPSLQTVTGWYDGRASADLPARPLTILARYTSVTSQSVEETKRDHPFASQELLVVLDGGGTGLALSRRK